MPFPKRILGLVVLILFLSAFFYLYFNDVRRLVIGLLTNGQEFELQDVHVYSLKKQDKATNTELKPFSSKSYQEGSQTSKEDTYLSTNFKFVKVDSKKNGTFQEISRHNRVFPAGLGQSLGSTRVENRDAGRTCLPLKNIVFFKMHKCGSSTVQNILFRYGEEYKLNFVLPPAGNYLGHSAFNRRYMVRFPVEDYNIFCFHTIFNFEGIANVMPINSVYLTILRNPVQMFESLFSYNDVGRMFHLPKTRSLELFFKKPEYFYGKSDGGILHLRNPMLYGLGLPKSDLNEPNAIGQKIGKIEDQFDLVMISEYFEESLILLRELLCWKLDDVVYFIHNARIKSSVKQVSPQLANKIHKWNHGDVMLYSHFNRTFWNKVEAFGLDRMKQEVSKLKERNRYFMERCISLVIIATSQVWHPFGIHVNSFQLKPNASRDKMCVRMTEPELVYANRLLTMQMTRYKMN